MKIARKENTVGAVAITVGKLPKGLTADALVIPAKGLEGTLTLHAAAAPESEQAPTVLEISAQEQAQDGASAKAKIAAFVRGTPGSLDTTFADAGMSLQPFGGIDEAGIKDAKVLSDGSILLGTRRTTFASLSRMTSAGQFDPTFAGGGTTNLGGGQGTSLVVDAFEPPGVGNGFIYAMVTNNVAAATLFRMNLAGALDTAFNGSGKVTVGTGASQVFALPDGKALVFSGVVTRWKTNGVVDETYGTGGTCPLAAAGERMLLRPGGAVFVLGDGKVRGCTATGAVDTSIGSSPNFYELAPGTLDFARTPSGGLVFLLTTGGKAGWYRLNAAFSADGPIGMSGATTALNAPASLIAQDDGGILVGAAEGSEFRVVRYTSKGALDLDFGTDGMAIFNIAGTNTAEFAKLVAQPDGRILAVGKHYDVLDAAILAFLALSGRLRADGTRAIHLHFGGLPTVGNHRFSVRSAARHGKNSAPTPSHSSVESA